MDSVEFDKSYSLFSLASQVPVSITCPSSETDNLMILDCTAVPRILVLAQLVLKMQDK
jgi:hypothetical protein